MGRDSLGTCSTVIELEDSTGLNTASYKSVEYCLAISSGVKWESK
jgi:hypothetical protein